MGTYNSLKHLFSICVSTRQKCLWLLKLVWYAHVHILTSDNGPQTILRFPRNSPCYHQITFMATTMARSYHVSVSAQRHLHVCWTCDFISR